MTDEQSGEQIGIAVRTREDVRRLAEADRRRLAAWISETHVPAPLPPAARRRRRRVLAVASGGVAVLLPWVVWLAATLPQTFRADAWSATWVGFDVALVGAFAATAWLGWRARQAVITAFVVTATLLLCDAWFDLTLSFGSKEEAASILTAVVAELPVAFFLLATYHRLLRTVTVQAWRDRGHSGEPPPLWRVPLLLSAQPLDRLPLHRAARASGSRSP